MNPRPLVLGTVCLFMTACAQVPKASVELSTTIGRDLAVVHESHRDLAKVLFSRMRADINRFVDDVYAPHQISAAMEKQMILSKSTNPEDRKKSLLLAINQAFNQNGTASSKLQKNVLKGMEIMVKKINDDIESMRTELLSPVAEQEKQILASIDRTYQQLHYANSIVTGHLASIVKVHDAQAELLDKLGVERDLRTAISEDLTKASTDISKLVIKADRNLDSVKSSAGKLKAVLQELDTKLKL